MPEYSLNELAALADVTPRTIRFYIEQGLLPAPATLGPKSRYTDEHFERLLLIKKMQASGMPLATIRAQLRSMGVLDIAASNKPSDPPRVAESAVDYIRGVLGTGPGPAPAPAARPAPAAHSVPSPSYDIQPSEPDRSQWDRVGVTPDIEIHIRRPASRTDQKRINRLIEYARQLFREES
jgi:DNA-binding transcriptional MerR regulator